MYVPDSSFISATRLGSWGNMFFLLWQINNELVPSKYSISFVSTFDTNLSQSSGSSSDKSSQEFSNNPQCESSRTIFWGELILDKDILGDISFDMLYSSGQKVPLSTILSFSLFLFSFILCCNYTLPIHVRWTRNASRKIKCKKKKNLSI